MMRSDNLNCRDHVSYMEMADPSLNIKVTDEDESKLIIVDKNLLEKFSTDLNKSKRNIVNETLSQNCSADESKCSTKEDES